MPEPDYDQTSVLWHVAYAIQQERLRVAAEDKARVLPEPDPAP